VRQRDQPLLLSLRRGRGQRQRQLQFQLPLSLRTCFRYAHGLFFRDLFDVLSFQLAQQQQQQQQQGAGGLGAGAGLGGLGGPNLSALRDNNQMRQLRQQAAENPELLQQLIQQLAAGNPQLGQLLANNPEMLANILGGGGDGPEGEGEGVPGVSVVNVTPEEQAAIERVSLEQWRTVGC